MRPRPKTLILLMRHSDHSKQKHTSNDYKHIACSNLQSKKIKSFWSNNLVQVFSSKLLTGHREREICLFYPTQGTKKAMT